MFDPLQDWGLLETHVIDSTVPRTLGLPIKVGNHMELSFQITKRSTFKSRKKTFSESLRKYEGSVRANVGYPDPSPILTAFLLLSFFDL